MKSEKKVVKGTGPKRTEQERERDLVIIAGMYLQSYSLYQIVTLLNNREGIHYTICLTTVFNDIKEIQRKWKESQLEAMEEAKMQALQKIDAVEHQAWLAWERSLMLVSRSETKAIKNQIGVEKETDNLPDKIEKKVFEATGEGNPAYLNIILACVDKRAKIWGLMTAKVDLTSGGKNLVGSVIVLPDNNRAENELYNDEYIQKMIAQAGDNNSDK